MKEFDHEGLLLAEYQGKLFEKSTELKCSTPVFLRRFLHSDFLKKMDKNDVTSLTLDVNEGILNIENQFLTIEILIGVFVYVYDTFRQLDHRS